jgi:hypothetical protein
VKNERPTAAQVDAAARVLDFYGRHHGWWPSDVADFDNLDPIGKDELGTIAEQILIAASKASQISN